MDDWGEGEGRDFGLSLEWRAEWKALLMAGRG